MTEKTYYTCAKVRKEIDAVLEINNIDNANTMEKNLSIEDKEDLHERCASRLLSVYDLDKSFIKPLLTELDLDEEVTEE